MLDEDCVASIDRRSSFTLAESESFSYPLPPFLFHLHLLLTDEGKTVDGLVALLVALWPCGGAGSIHVPLAS